jgi:hypothetical protein
MGEQGISEAFTVAVEAIAKIAGVKPLPSGVTSVEAGDWTLTINASKDEVRHGEMDLAPYTVFANNKVYLAFALISPIDGAIGGMPESEFIDQMRALAA